LVDEVEPLYRENIHKAMAGCGERDCRQLIKLLERIRTQTGALQNGMPNAQSS
jgi:hypothetical protein